MPKISTTKTRVRKNPTDKISSEPENKKFNYTPLFIALLLIASYLLGMLTTKVAYLEKNITTTPNTISPQPNQPQTNLSNTLIKTWAKELGLNMKNFNNCFDKKDHMDLIDQDLSDGQTAGVDGTPTFFINGEKIVGALPYADFKTAIDAALNHTNTNEAKVDIATGHLPSLGKKDAPVVMVEFSDFQCPFCNTFFKNTFNQIKSDYIDTGKLVLYYRHFPLDIHPFAKPFAQAAECANDQNQFWQMHNKMFQEQE